MHVPKEIVQLASTLASNDIDYRIVGGQAAVLYGLRDDSKDWDFAVAEVTPDLKQLMKTVGFSEIPDTNGLSWENKKCLVDFVIGDGKNYPTIKELGIKSVHGLDFIARSMMGYVNWKEGKSAFQELENYREDLRNTELPKKITDNYNVDWLKQSMVQLRLIKQAKKRSTTMLKPLVSLANKLDEAGLVVYADELDGIVKQAQAEPTEPAVRPNIPYQKSKTMQMDVGIKQPDDEFNFDPAITERAKKVREKTLFDEVMTKVTGFPVSMLDFYQSVMPHMRSLLEAVNKAEKLPEGSSVRIELTRKINDAYNTVFDPRNVSLPFSQIKFICEIGRIFDIVKHNMPKFNKPDYTDERVVDEFVNQLKAAGLLSNLNKLKRQK